MTSTKPALVVPGNLNLWSSWSLRTVRFHLCQHSDSTANCGITKNHFRSFWLGRLFLHRTTPAITVLLYKEFISSQDKISTLTQKAEQQISWQFFKQLAVNNYKFTSPNGFKRNLLYLLLERGECTNQNTVQYSSI